MTDTIQKQIKELTEELLKKLQVNATVVTTEKDGAILVTLETEESGLLIGHYGRNLEGIQVLLGQMVYKLLGTWVRIVVSVGDYRERRAKQLEEMALQAAEKVVASGEPVVFTDLSPGDRRTVHLVLGEHPQVMSESEGEGRDRRLTVKLKS